MKFTIDPGNAEEFGIHVCKSPEGKEQTTISCNMEDDQVVVDLSKTSLDKDLMAKGYEGHNYLQKADLELSGKQKVSFHIFIDHSVLEIFVNNKLCLTHRIYPTLENSKGVSVFSKGGNIEIPVFKSWKMNPSNPY